MDIKKMSSISGAIAALFASACCLGPLILAGLGAGAGAIGFLKGFGRFHNFFMVLTVILFVSAFWFIYRKRDNPEVQGACCTSPILKKEKIILWVSIAVAFTLLILPFLI